MSRKMESFMLAAGISGRRFSPLTIFDGSVSGGWYKAQAAGNFQEEGALTPVANGSPLGYVSDLSGNGNPILQGSAAKLMTYVESGGLNYFNVVSGTCALVNCLMTIAQPFYMWVAWKQIPAIGVGTRYLGGSAAGGTLEIIKQTGGGVMQHRASAGGAVNGVTVTSGAFAVTTHFFNGGSGFMMLDEQALITTSAGSNGLTGFVLGNNAAQGASGLQFAQFHEIVIAKRGSDDLHALYGAAMRKYLLGVQGRS